MFTCHLPVLSHCARQFQGPSVREQSYAAAAGPGPGRGGGGAADADTGSSSEETAATTRPAGHNDRRLLIGIGYIRPS
ncbi:hypothetical protein GCM10010449_77840 [Streptomyces rectiviolaceus]|uniref:Uncharacterized protein n=1 Tax=Streptomyces rectiviolaceus TaxID=332591 RepID=A0ABP6NIN9_9ACTN